jgi:hypothetical protein
LVLTQAAVRRGVGAQKAAERARLAGPDFGLLPVAKAVAFVLRQHRFHAGRYQIGYQSCDASTAIAGQSDPKKCESNAKAYAADPALLGIVGVYNSPCAQAEIPILNAANGGPVAMVSPSNSAVGLTHHDPLAPAGALARMYPTGSRNYARVYPPFDAEAAADAILARQLGVRRAYVLDDGGGVRDLALHFRRSARAIGLDIAGSRRWDPTGTGFGALVEHIRRARADGRLPRRPQRLERRAAGTHAARPPRRADPAGRRQPVRTGRLHLRQLPRRR